MIWGSRFGGLKRGRRDREGEWVWWRFGRVLRVCLDFVGQWWCGYVGYDLCGSFWLIWVFGNGCDLRL